MSNIKRTIHLSLVTFAGFLLLAYQNCAPMNFENTSDKVSGFDNEIPDPRIPDNHIDPIENDDGGHPIGGGDGNDTGDDGGDGSGYTSDAYCEEQLKGNTQVTYASIADTNSEYITITGSDLNAPVNAENISFAGKGNYKNISITARNLNELGSLNAQSIYINAVNVGHLEKFNTGTLTVLANHIESVSKLNAVFCLNAHSISKVESLAAKASIYGRSENGSKAKLASFKKAAAFMSFHDLEIGEIESGAFSGRIENSTVQSLSKSAGVVYLVNSRVESVSNFAGTIYLIGDSSIGSQSQSSIRIIKK